MIVSGGENVFPREVEDLLADHAEIEEAAVVGVADEEFGQRLKAFVVPRDGAELSEEEVQEYVKQNLARYKVPREVVFVAELPRNATGKVLKRELRRGRLSSASAAPLAWRAMAAETHDFDLAGLRLSAGEGRRLELEVPIEPLQLGSERYAADAGARAGRADVSRMSGGGYALRLRFSAARRGTLHALPEAGRARASRSRRARSTGRAAARSSTAPTCTTRRSTWPPGRATRSRWRCP